MSILIINVLFLIRSLLTSLSKLKKQKCFELKKQLKTFDCFQVQELFIEPKKDCIIPYIYKHVHR